MQRSISQSLVKDWNSLRDNKNGCFKVIENLENALESRSHEERLRALRKIDTTCRGEGHFVPKLVKSTLFERIVDLAVQDANGDGDQLKERQLCEDILARAVRTKAVALNEIGARFLDVLVNRLCKDPSEQLYSIVDALVSSTQWRQTMRRNEILLEHLATKQVGRFGTLAKMPEEAIKFNTVQLCLEGLHGGKKNLRNDETATDRLKCLHMMTYFAQGRDAALPLGAVQIMIELLKEHVGFPLVTSPCLGILTNLLQDPSHAAKKEAIDLEAGALLMQFIPNSVDSMLPKVEEDEILYALQAISVYCTHPAGQREFLESDRISALSRVLESARQAKKSLIVQAAEDSIQLIRRKV